MTTPAENERLEDLRLKADAAEAAGDLATAEKCLQTWVAFAPDHAPAWRRLAKLQVRAGRVRDGIAALTRAAALRPDTGKFITLAQLEAGEGNWAAADAWLAQAAALDPKAIKISNLRGNLAAEFGYYTVAATHFRRVLDRAPEDITVLQALCYVLAYSDIDAVVAVIEQFLDRPTLPLADRVMVMRLLVQFKERQLRSRDKAAATAPHTLGFHFATDEIRIWHDLAMTWLSQEPDSYDAMQMAAQSLIAGGKTLAAEPYFTKFRVLGKNDVAAVTFLDPAYHTSLDDVSLQSMQATLPPVIAVGSHAGEWDRIVLAGCDLHYAEKYASPLLGSFIRHREPGTLFHLHIFDCTAEEAARFLRRIEKCGPAQIVVTREWTGFRTAESREPASTAARGYYHAVRYIRFREFLDKHPDAPALIVDADMMFNHPPRGVFNFLKSHDMVCPIGAGRLEIHNQMTACAVGLAPTARGRKYFHRVAAYLFACWQQGRLPWGVDQTALYCVYMAMQAQGESVDIVDLPRNLHTVDFLEDSILWGGKCSPEHAGYERYLAAVARFQLPDA